MLSYRLALLSTVCLLPYMATPALAARAGVTAAVNQSAVGTPPGGAVRTIVLGADVLQDEKIDTSGKGLVQILLADGTTFTVGPNSSLTIDHFVYDPAAGTAQVSASLAKGVFRFIGGKTSKTPDGVTLNTPVGTVGIRGAVVDINLVPNGHDIKAEIDMLFGEWVTLTSNDGGQRIYHPGYSIIVGTDGHLHLVKTPPGSTNQIQLALTGHPHTNGGSHNAPTDTTVLVSGVSQTNSDHPPADNTPPPTVILPSTDPAEIALQVIQQADAGDTHNDAGNATPTTPPPVVPPPLSGKFNGVASGIASGTYTPFESCGTSFGPVLLTSGQIEMDFTPPDGSGSTTLGAQITANGDGDPLSAVDLSVGDGADEGSSTFVDNQNYAATGSSSDASATWSAGGPVSGGGDKPPTLTSGIPNFTGCTTCAFMQWGSWNTDFTTPFEESGGGPGQVTANGLWVAADEDDWTTPEQLAGRTGSATYQGQAAGTVSDSANPAVGNLNVTVNFGEGLSTVAITDFDSHDMSANFERSGGGFTTTTGSITRGGTGTFNTSGQFVNNGGDIAAGVMGDFNAQETGDGGWSASGIYVGGRVGALPPQTTPSPGG